jgi:hypothetical protein
MEHAFWQRHRYLHEIHVFIYSNTSRVIQTNINEMVHQSCQSLIKDIMNLKKEKKVAESQFQSLSPTKLPSQPSSSSLFLVPIDSQPSPRAMTNNNQMNSNSIGSPSNEPAMIVFEKIFSVTIERSNQFFQDLYNKTTQSQLPSLYCIHSVAPSVKKLAMFYTKKQLFSFFTNRKEYFRNYCFKKLQQLIEKLDAKSNTEMIDDILMSPGLQRQSSFDTLNDNASLGFIPAPLATNNKEHNFLDECEVKNLYLNCFKNPHLFVLSNNRIQQDESVSYDFQLPTFTNPTKLLNLIPSLFSSIAQFIEIIFPFTLPSHHHKTSFSSHDIQEKSKFLEKFFFFMKDSELWTDESILVINKKLNEFDSNNENTKSFSADFYYGTINGFFKFLMMVKDESSANKSFFKSSAFNSFSISEFMGKISCELYILLAVSLPFLFSLDYFYFLESLIVGQIPENDETFATRFFLKRLFVYSNQVDTDKQAVNSRLSFVSQLSLLLQEKYFLSISSMVNLFEIITRKKILAFYENCKRLPDGQRVVTISFFLLIGNFLIRYKEAKSSEISDKELANQWVLQTLGKEFHDIIENFGHQWILNNRNDPK